MSTMHSSVGGYTRKGCHAKAAEIIAQGRGSHFDPDVVDAFFQIEQTFIAIAQRYIDTDQELQAKAEQS